MSYFFPERKIILEGEHPEALTGFGFKKSLDLRNSFRDKVTPLIVGTVGLFDELFISL